jgi:uncharacterized membrane protein YcaP (DUF421 family)
LRLDGHGSLHDVHAVVLETDGTFSVITSGGAGGAALEGVSGYRPAGSA